MRSVFVFLRTAERPEVERWLTENFRFQSGPPWIVDIQGDACLYIEIYDNWHDDHEPEGWQRVSEGFGWEPTCGVIADVSGRHPGDEQVSSFVLSTLERFDGVAMDDYTEHGWTRTQAESNSLVQGHRFFDTWGWYEEERKGAG